MSKAILPGATIGVLGSGQLGRIFSIAARELGYRVMVGSMVGTSLGAAPGVLLAQLADWA